MTTATKTFTRRRLRSSPAYSAGDAREWIDESGRYLVRLVRRAYGVSVMQHVAALYSRTPGRFDVLISRHRKISAAIKACQRHARGEA